MSPDPVGGRHNKVEEKYMYVKNRIFVYAKIKAQISVQRFCFCYTDGTIPLLSNPKFQASSPFL